MDNNNMETIEPLPKNEDNRRSSDTSKIGEIIDDVYVVPKQTKELRMSLQGSSNTRRFSLQDERQTMKCCKLSDRVKAYKNILGECLSFVACFGSFLGILSLQSSINSAQGLGLTSNATSYALLIITTFFAPAFVKLIGSKYALLSGYILFLIYTLSNYYPSWYTLIPGAALSGVAQGPVWVSMYTHAVLIARKYAIALKEKPENAVALFTGAVASSAKVAQVSGSLISSLVLINMNKLNISEVNNSSDETCTGTATESLEQGLLFYILISAYVGVVLFGIFVTITFMDHLGTDSPFLSPTKMCKLYVGKPFVIVLKTLVDWKMVLLGPLIILDGVMLGYTFGAFPKEYIADCVGVEWIGFVLAVFGASGAISAFVAGRIVRYLPQCVIVYVAIIGSFGISFFIIFWEKQSSFVVIFLFAILWGWCESTFNSAVPGLLGILFDGEKREAAFSLLQGFIAIGFVISFTTALVLNAARQLWIVIVLLLISTLTYSIVFFKTSTKAQLIPCIYKDKEDQKVEVEDNPEQYEMEDINSNLSHFNPLSQRPSISVKEILEEKNSV